jgi:hypothetical protein
MIASFAACSEVSAPTGIVIVSISGGFDEGKDKFFEIGALRRARGYFGATDRL